ncbi:LAME_0G06920g1_1 [Lachancea meyersii CBS 8951]|uniref:LAME_0G06920g1_1 n=1 Tax=Lachancea meyersii CBS 8951 TaxID=1266667 RepID=A0A1G4K7W3_9SACH|nr:LAME_0G06920g1_1 [Lachancea meyersii CBS 8951]
MTRIAKRVAIIGAGPSGLSAARAFLANTDFELVLYDSKPQVGGVWFYPDDEQQRASTAMYDSLETNLSKDIMSFNGFPFSDSVKQFPTRSQVQEYLIHFYETFVKNQNRARVQLNCTVELLQKNGDSWELCHSGSRSVEVFDFVVIANGHFDIPYVPTDIPGLGEWRKEDPSSLLHSKEFQSSEPFRGQKVVVVGNGSSGSDIANQISSVAEHVFHSVTEISKANWDENPIVTPVTKISQLRVHENRTVELQNGELLHDIDCIVWATGYMYHIPFLGSYQDEILGTQHARNPVSRLHGLWRQIVFSEDPTLAFSLLCKNVVPFPVAESQACLIAKIFCGAVDVPLMDSSARAMGNGKDYHSLVMPRDIEYCRDLQGILDSCGGLNDPFQPRRWDEQMAALRYQTAAAKNERTKLLVRRAMQLRQNGQAYCLE